MAKKYKITAWVVVCMVWELVVIGIHIFMSSQLKFPTLNPELFGWLIPVFMAVPFIVLFLGLVSIDRKKPVKILAIVFAILSIVIYVDYIFLTTGGFRVWEPGLYPLMSETEDIKDYLVFDDDFAENYDEIVDIIPETVPDDATYVVYNYYFEPGFNGFLYVYWELPKDDYAVFKKEILKKDGIIENIEDGVKVSLNWNQKEIFGVVGAELLFNDESNCIHYKIIANYAC